MVLLVEHLLQDQVVDVLDLKRGVEDGVLLATLEVVEVVGECLVAEPGSSATFSTICWIGRIASARVTADRRAGFEVVVAEGDVHGACRFEPVVGQLHQARVAQGEAAPPGPR